MRSTAQAQRAQTINASPQTRQVALAPAPRLRSSFLALGAAATAVSTASRKWDEMALESDTFAQGACQCCMHCGVAGMCAWAGQLRWRHASRYSGMQWAMHGGSAPSLILLKQQAGPSKPSQSACLSDELLQRGVALGGVGGQAQGVEEGGHLRAARCGGEGLT